MSKRNERQKASDVFRETSYTFAKKVSFDEAFPEIEDFTIEVEESVKGISDLGRKATFRKQNFPGEYMKCSNKYCYKGGFSIVDILREMVSSKQTNLETLKKCQGNEGSPKGKRIYRSCTNFFTVKVLIKYRERS